MKILLLNDEYPPQGQSSVAKITKQLAEEYEKKGHEVTVMTTHRKEEVDEIKRDRNVISLPVSYQISQRHWKCLKMEKVSRMLETEIGLIQPDVVHAHNLHTYLTYDALRISRKYTKKIFLTAHDTFLVSYDRVRGKNNRIHWWNNLLSAGRRYCPIRNYMIKKILNQSGCSVVAISNATKSFFETNAIKIHSVIPNGIDLVDPISNESVQNFRIENSLTGPTLLFAGRIREDKGIGVAIKAFDVVLNRLPSAKFLVVGEIERLTPFLNDKIRDSVITTGWISGDKINIAYAATDIVIAPSIYLDNFPTVNLEAMAAGKPVVGTCFGGTPEAVLDGETGIIINPNNIDDFAQAILDLLTNKELRSSMGKAARNRISQHFSLDQQVQNYLRIFSE